MLYLKLKISLTPCVIISTIGNFSGVIVWVFFLFCYRYFKYMGIPDYRLNNLKQLRNQAGLTQQEVATMIGVKDPRVVSKWETGRTQPNITTLIKLSILYSTLIDKLYRGLALKIRDENPVLTQNRYDDSSNKKELYS